MILNCVRAFCIIFLFAVMNFFSGTIGCTGPASSTTPTFHETCAEIQEATLEETGDRPDNGTYTLYIDGDEDRPFDVYCDNMRRSEPSEYLTVNENNNYSQIRSEAGVATTSYLRIRIDPVRLTIDPFDTTFADSNFNAYTPLFPSEDMEHIPLGWAEYQSMAFNDGETAESKMDLTDTGFVFDNALSVSEAGSSYFCQVDSDGVFSVMTTGTEFDVATDLTSFTLNAANNNSPNYEDARTRMVVDCANMGSAATEFTTGEIPLTYQGN